LIHFYKRYTKMAFSPGDPSSYSRPDQVKTTHIHIEWDVDFDKMVLASTCTYSMTKVDSAATSVLMDVKALDITSIKLESTGEDMKFKIDQETNYGSRLEIHLPAGCDKEFKMLVKYSTTSQCTALMWMLPEQTAGGVHPFMFSQCQAIHARSMLPCQDTPSVKATYSASVTAPEGITVLMSALRKHDTPQEQGQKKKYCFEQTVPVMSYLIAIAAGDLKSRKIGPRSHVWAEEKFLDEAAADFSETEKMLKIAEDLCGTYVWGIYDILVLPPSFPFGGMENPCLTFVTPTLLSGDKANATVIAHEITHSWTGNLVTNINFEHFWLNEGFTKFTEYKIKGRLLGEPLQHFTALLEWTDLTETIINVFGVDNPLTKLVPDLKGIDPDDAFSSVPYIKGSSFLWHLEAKVGGAAEFEPFLKSYYEKFKYQSISTDMFKEYFLQYFASCDAVKDIDWDTWLYAPGMPPNKPDFDSSLATPCYDLAARWRAWSEDQECPFTEDDLKEFLPEQTLEFLNSLKTGKALSPGAVDKMTELYKFAQSKNMEILFRWIRVGIAARYDKCIPAAVDLVSKVGRMKYVRPIYRDLFAWPEKKQVALDTFEANKKRMMAVSRDMVAKDLHVTV
jgi:leukotriene-A4 hydrolase